MSQDEEKPLLLEDPSQEPSEDDQSRLLKPSPKKGSMLLLIIFYIFGLAMLFPWNVFINATSYFRSKFANSPFADNFNSFFSIGYNMSNIIGLGFLFLISTKKISYESQTSVGLFINVVVFIGMMVVVGGPSQGSAAFGATMAAVILSGLNTGLIQSGVFGSGAQIAEEGPALIGGAMSGQGLAGLAVSVSEIVISAISGPPTKDDQDLITEGESERISALVYFGIALALLVVTFICSIMLPHIPSYKMRLFKRKDSIKTPAPSLLQAVAITGTKVKLFFSDSSSSLHKGKKKQGTNYEKLESDSDLKSDSKSDSKNDSKSYDTFQEASSTASLKNPSQAPKKEERLTLWDIVVKTKQPSFAVCYNFFVTLALFPTILASIESVNTTSESRIYKDLFVSFTFLIFNFGDLLGRLIAGKFPTAVPVKFLTPLSLLRTVFFFFFLCSNVVLRDQNGEIIENSLPILFKNDYLYWLLNLIFSTSNGYLASICMISGPKLVNERYKGKAGTLMAFALVAGLCFGSFFSFALRAILCQCNPFIS